MNPNAPLRTKPAPLTRSDRASLIKQVAIVFFGFLAVGLPLPPIALYMHDQLGFSAGMIGFAIGIQSVVTVLSRHRAGTLSDNHGARYVIRLGLPLSALAGLFYLLAASAPLAGEAKLALLIMGRIALGFGESLFITGAMSWCIGRLGPQRTGLVMSWQGIAMYSAIGLGAPIGLALYAATGFAGVGIAAALSPLIALGIAYAIPDVPPTGHAQRTPFYKVIGLIWRSGMVLFLATIPFAGITGFMTLAYLERGWSGAGLALTAFSTGFIALRLVASHLPDVYGGARVAMVSLAVEALGQAMIWLAPNPTVALAGAFVTGLGFSLIFPAMGVEATRRVPIEQRGRAVANFIAFFDLAIGVTAPAVGYAAGLFGYGTAFLIGAVAALAALVMAARG
ncbi:MFS transporter [Tardiphaga alba]|uniref:MFS transporter n=1 Tax=Tardiphaga alba TaxID=340268 RepID=A0ABX8A760_9BRAD|nr:MFS transporter [Tardiphaga alba]QUS39489.1 MFS transporter [Tardiphaga alba]